LNLRFVDTFSSDEARLYTLLGDDGGCVGEVSNVKAKEGTDGGAQDLLLEEAAVLVGDMSSKMKFPFGSAVDDVDSKGVDDGAINDLASCCCCAKKFTPPDMSNLNRGADRAGGVFEDGRSVGRHMTTGCGITTGC
jgi:hypothetical protein